jgi:sRNA-binding regulator protein Hfq
MNKSFPRETPLTSSATALLDPPAPPATPAERREPASPRKSRVSSTPAGAKRFAATSSDEHASNRQAELFYLQKQIQLQTQMVFILEDGSRVQGIIEWYDRNSIKVRGKSRTLVYKAAIKYLYKAGEIGSAPEA